MGSVSRTALGALGALAAAGVVAVGAPSAAVGATLAQDPDEGRECECRAWGNAQPLSFSFSSAFSRARIGVSLDTEAQHERGAVVTDLLEDGPAERAGLLEGDVITAIDGVSLLSPLEARDERRLDEGRALPAQRLMVLAREWDEGDEIEVTVLRDGSERTILVEAEDSPSFRLSTLAGRLGNQSEDLARRLGEAYAFQSPRVTVGPDAVVWSRFGRVPGLSLTPLNPGLGAYFQTDSGVLVTDVDEDTPTGLEAGDVIVSIGGRQVDEPADVYRILRSYDDDENVRWEIVRHGQTLTVDGTLR